MLRIWPLVVENISEERRRNLKFGYFWSMRGRELLFFSRTEGKVKTGLQVAVQRAPAGQ